MNIWYNFFVALLYKIWYNSIIKCQYGL
jgi:hypothetical protein